MNAEAYAQIVAAHATRRRMIHAANQIAVLAYDEKQDIAESTEQAVKALEQIAMRTSGEAWVPLSSSLSETYDRVDRSSRTVEFPVFVPACRNSISYWEIFNQAMCTSWPPDPGRARPVLNPR